MSDNWNEDLNNEEFNFDDMEKHMEKHVELLSLAGYWQILKNIKRHQKLMIETKSGRNIVGTKDFFDEATGILKMLCSHKIAEESNLSDNPVLKDIYIIRRIHMSMIEAICTFPNITK